MTSDRVKKASDLFHAGCSCAQSVVAAWSDAFGLDEKTAMRVSCGLGAGVGRLREVCGAVSGMAILAGLKHGNDVPGDADAKALTYEVVQQMARVFHQRHGSLICRTLLGLDKAEGGSTPSARTSEYYAKRPCAALVATAAELVGRFLQPEDAQQQV